jgi:hypothetical protein
MIAPGKRSAGRDYGRNMISSFFLPVWRASQCAKPEGKRRCVWDALPRAAASAALPGATVWPPLWGFGTANKMVEPTAAGPMDSNRPAATCKAFKIKLV